MHKITANYLAENNDGTDIEYAKQFVRILKHSGKISISSIS